MSVGSKDGLARPNHYLGSQFIYLVGLGIIIIFSLSAKKGPMSMDLSGFLGTSDFGNGSHFS